MLGDRITGWYKSCPVNIYTLKILIKMIILFEQWPYRMCMIFQILENYKEQLLKLPEDTTNNIIESTEESTNSENSTKNNDSENITLDIVDDEENEIETLEEWLNYHRFSTLQEVYENIPEYILNNKTSCNMQCYDYNHYLFEKFLDIEPNITVEYFYICIGYIFNINYSMKNMISKILNKNNE